MSGLGAVDEAILPDGWQVAKIGDHFEFKNGLNKAKHFFGHGTPIINYMDVYRHAWLLPFQVSGKVSVTRTEQQAYSAKQHDAFFTRTSETVAEIGMCSVLMGPIDSAVFSGFVLRARPVGDELLPGFAAYALRGRKVREQIESSATYTTRALTNGRSLSAVNFPLPPKPEQQRIIAALRDIDDLITSLDALIAKKRDIKEAVEQQLLSGEKRLADSSEPWRVRRLGELAELSMGGTPSRRRPDFWSGSNPWVSIRDMSRKVISSTSEKISDEAAMMMQMIPSGTLIMSFKLSLGKLAFAGTDLFTNEAICAIRDIKGCKEYFYHALKLVDFSLYGKQAVKGYTLNMSSLKSIEVPCPPLSEQKAIAEVLDNIDEELESLVLKREKVIDCRRGMMQQLLTGRIRLV